MPSNFINKWAKGVQINWGYNVISLTSIRLLAIHSKNWLYWTYIILSKSGSINMMFSCITSPGACSPSLTHPIRYSCWPGHRCKCKQGWCCCKTWNRRCCYWQQIWVYCAGKCWGGYEKIWSVYWLSLSVVVYLGWSYATAFSFLYH